MRGVYWCVGLPLIAACGVGASGPAGVPAEHNALGVATWQTDHDPSGQITIVGEDEAGKEVAKVELFSGTFQLSDHYAQELDGASPVVDGRRLAIEVNGKLAFDWESPEHTAVHLPAVQQAAWRVAAIVEDPYVKDQLDRVAIGFQRFLGVKGDPGQGETPYYTDSGTYVYGISPVGNSPTATSFFSWWKFQSFYNGVVWGGRTNNGVVCGGGTAQASSTNGSLDIVFQRGGIDNSTRDMDVIMECCINGSRNDSRPFFEVKHCTYDNVANDCGTQVVCAPCGTQYIDPTNIVCGLTWVDVGPYDGSEVWSMQAEWYAP
jgi:hypothetical protein